jgi:hypothetical protein
MAERLFEGPERARLARSRWLVTSWSGCTFVLRESVELRLESKKPDTTTASTFGFANSARFEYYLQDELMRFARAMRQHPGRSPKPERNGPRDLKAECAMPDSLVCATHALAVD